MVTFRRVSCVKKAVVSFLFAIAICRAAFSSAAAFVPIALTAASYNQDIVVENTAPPPVVSGGYTTASMDSGMGNSGTSWYEQGYDTAAPTTGLPHAGATFTGQSSATHRYTMAPSYQSNNAILLDSTVTRATFTLQTPTACSALSLLESGGNNGVSFSYTVHHQGGLSETGSATIPDWYNGASTGFTANGRVDVQSYALSSVNGNDPRLYSLDLTLANTTNPVTSVDFTYLSGGGHGAIMALSGDVGGNFVPLAVTGYNEDIVVEAAAGKPGSLTGVTTATMDTGTTNTGNTWYQAGYLAIAPNTGLPAPGSTLTNLSAPDHLYAVAPSYTANNVALISSNHPSVTLTPSTPLACQTLSFLTACGNGPATIGCAVYHANASVQSNDFVSPDWSAQAPIAFVPNGRINVGTKVVDTFNQGNPRLYAADVSLSNTNSPVTRIVLSLVGGAGDANAAIFAVSGGSIALPLAGDDFNANTAASASALQQWYNSGGLWNSTGWWNAANCIEAVENEIIANNDLPSLSILSNTFALNSGGNFLNDYYDDEGWWCNAWIRAFDLTGNAAFLAMAKTIFADMTTGWDTTCDGGIWWSKDRTYKNAIANELFIISAARLHQRTPGDSGAGSYFYWATNDWTWFHASGMINSQNLVNDGLTSACQNDGETTWTYNQGVLIGGLTDLYKITGSVAYRNEAEAIANAVITHFVDAKGVLVEQPPCNPTCGGGDVPQFKGVLSRYMAYLYDATRVASYYNFLYKSAHAVWFNDRNAFNQFGMSWDGPFDSADGARQSSAMMAVSALAEPITADLVFGKGSGDPAFTHPIGSATGSLAWNVGSASAGYAQTGPRVTYLAPGLHAVHFELAVANLNPASTSLGTIDVIDDNGSNILASAPIPWNAFTATNTPHDFALLFTNLVANDPLEFRVYWNNVAGAAPMTISDITVDGLLNFLGANLTHAIGKLDGLNSWQADLLSAASSGYLASGPNTAEIPTGDYTALFELKVDNFNYDNDVVATISVFDNDHNAVIASEDVTRAQFPNTLFQPFALNFNAVLGTHYSFRVYWYDFPNAPRVTLRSVLLRPGPTPFFTSIQAANNAATFNVTGSPGQSFSLQSTPSLTTPVWSTVNTGVIPANLGFTQITDTPATSTRFYRVSLP